VKARDARGASVPLDALPRRPHIVVEGAESPPEREAIFLFSGAPDAALLADLERAPILAANAARAVPCTVRRQGASLELVPDEPLALGASYTLAIAAFAVDLHGVPIGTPLAVPLTVAAEGAGAVVLETWPATGTYGVPPGIAWLAVHFDDDVDGLDAITLTTAEGTPIDAKAAQTACNELALGPGFCVAITPSAPLPEHATVRIEVGPEVLDRFGAAVGPYVAELGTGATTDLLDAPSLVPLACAIDETAVAGACALPLEVTLDLRGRTGAPARVALVAGALRIATSAPRGDFALALGGLTAGAELAGTLTLFGLDGQALAVEVPLRTAADLAPIAITEVRADPEGPEPDQEYVEVHNTGDRSVDLAGFALADDATKAGDVIPGPAVLPAGGYALLVAEGFDPESPDDDPVPPGVPLFRLDGSLGSAGLTNGGEPVYLRDASGRRVSAAPALAAPAPGVCIVRASEDGRRGAPEDFVPHPEGRCGPGAPDLP
jgi:hypothetical protein